MLFVALPYIYRKLYSKNAMSPHDVGMISAKEMLLLLLLLRHVSNKHGRAASQQPSRPN
jgi:hypothetical protein